jgi:hypothetical protein
MHGYGIAGRRHGFWSNGSAFARRCGYGGLAGHAHHRRRPRRPGRRHDGYIGRGPCEGTRNGPDIGSSHGTAQNGAHVEEREDGLTITGGKLHGARINTYGDHRMAMAFAAAGTAVDGVIIENPGCVRKTYPGFWDDLMRLGIDWREADR